MIGWCLFKMAHNLLIYPQNMNQFIMTTEESKVTPKHLKYSLAMADVCVSEEVADLTLRILERLQDLGSNFSLKDACEIRGKWERDYQEISEK